MQTINQISHNFLETNKKIRSLNIERKLRTVQSNLQRTTMFRWCIDAQWRRDIFRQSARFNPSTIFVQHEPLVWKLVPELWYFQILYQHVRTLVHQCQISPGIPSIFGFLAQKPIYQVKIQLQIMRPRQVRFRLQVG